MKVCNNLGAHTVPGGSGRVILALRSSGPADHPERALALRARSGEARAYGRGLKGVGLGRFSPRAPLAQEANAMTTTSTPSTKTPAAAEVVFTDAERVVLAGSLAGYRGLTRDAYALDLRQFVSWCDQHGLKLFSVRRSDTELYARHLEETGRARATVARRLCTVAGFYRYAEEEDPGAYVSGSPCPAAAARL